MAHWTADTDPMLVFSDIPSEFGRNHKMTSRLQKKSRGQGRETGSY
jgi:hypothetical protein